MSAGTDDDVIVKLEGETKVFGDITGQSGVTWEDTRETQKSGSGGD